VLRHDVVGWSVREVSEMVEQHVSNNIELAKTIDVQSMAPAIAEERRTSLVNIQGDSKNAVAALQNVRNALLQ